MLEKLESRMLLTGLPLGSSLVDTSLEFMIAPFFVEGTTLRINGTEAADTVEVRDSGAYLAITRNGEVRSFPIASLTAISIYGYGDNDIVRVLTARTLPFTIDGGSGSDNIWAGPGNNTLYGGPGVDHLHSGGGNDQLFGGVGNDFLYGGLGRDVFNGGDDVDEVSYEDHGAGVRAFMTGTAISGYAAEGDTINSDVEILRGGGGPDKLYAPPRTGITLFGGNGDDFLYGNIFGDYLNGGWGNDEITGGGGNDTQIGDLGNDLLRGEAGNDQLSGGPGNDRLFGDEGADNLSGGDNNDKLYAGAGPDIDRLLGDGGDDILISIGGGENDEVNGMAGYDSFWVDDAATETIDASTEEISRKAVHRVRNFENPVSFDGALHLSKELLGQDIRDPLEIERATYKRNYKQLPLFGTFGPKAEDVQQNFLGDCWVLAPLASVARTEPDFIRQMVVELGDGTYAVRLGGNRYFRVDADLKMNATFFNTGEFSGWTSQYAGFGEDPDGGNIFEGAAGVADNMRYGVLWGALVEKALVHYFSSYSVGGFWESYDALDGGFADNGYAALGVAGVHTDSGIDDGTDTLNWIQHQLSLGRAVTLCTQDSFWGVPGVLEELHCYSVDAVITRADGSRVLRLRNPWGNDGGNGNDGDMNDGYIEIGGSTAYDGFSDLYSAQIL